MASGSVTNRAAAAQSKITSRGNPGLGSLAQGDVGRSVCLAARWPGYCRFADGRGWAFGAKYLAIQFHRRAPHPLSTSADQSRTIATDGLLGAGGGVPSKLDTPLPKHHGGDDPENNAVDVSPGVPHRS